MKTFFLNKNHLVRDTSVSNQYFDVKICSRIYINTTYMTHENFFLKTNHMVRHTPVSNQYFDVKICSRIYVNNTYIWHMKTFFLKKNHLVRDTPVSNQYFDVKICRICICWTWNYFPLKNNAVKNTPVSKQYYSYTIHVWLWYNLMPEGYDTKTFSLKKIVWWGTYRSLTQYNIFMRKSEKLKRWNYWAICFDLWIFQESVTQDDFKIW
jgi:ribosomal protein L40E